MHNPGTAIRHKRAGDSAAFNSGGREPGKPSSALQSPEHNGNGNSDHFPSAAGVVELRPFLGVGLALGAMAFFYFSRSVLMPVVLASIGGMALKPIVVTLTRWHIPRLLAAALVILFVIAGAGAGFYYVSRPAVTWVNEAPEHLTELRQRLQRLFQPAEQFKQAAAALDNAATFDDGKKKMEVKVRNNGAANAVLAWTGTTLLGLGETLVLLFLYLASGDCFSDKLGRMASTRRSKKNISVTIREIERNVSKYLFSVSIINLGVGTIIGLGLYFIGVPNAALWGAVAALLNFIPYFGPIAGVFLVGVVGLFTFDSFPRALFPVLWYLTLHLMEANVVTPMILGERFTIHPVIVFISLMFWTWLWGAAGALLSVPLLMAFKVICSRVNALTPINEFLTE